MSYVHCGYCGKRGHNKLGCPERKAAASRDPDSYLAKRVAAEDERRRASVARRVCTYCRQPGHNRAGCTTLKEDRRLILARQSDYIQDFLRSCAEVGLGPGSLVKIPRGDRSSPYHKYVLSLVTEFDWTNIDFMNLDSTSQNSWGIRNRTIMHTRTVGHHGYDHPDNWGRPPAQGTSIGLTHHNLSRVLSSILTHSDAECDTVTIVGPASVPFVVPPTVITDSLNAHFALNPDKRAKSWEKRRRHLSEPEWSKVRPTDYNLSIQKNQ